MSPFSAEIVLALTNEGAFGETSEELHKGLSLPKTKEATQEAVKDLLPKLRKAEKDLKLQTANKIYASKNIKVNPGFNDIAKSVYNAGEFFPVIVDYLAKASSLFSDYSL